MTVTAALFRTNFPAFGDSGLYSNSEIAFWLTLGSKLHDPTRWGDFIDEGLQLFIAHNLVLEMQSQQAADSGNAPGQVQGALTSASVDKVSYSRDAAAAMDPANGHWNLTTYGLRWVRIQRLVGAGPVQIGVPCGSVPTGAWPGPFPSPW